VAGYIGSVGWEQKYSTSPPTKTHRDAYGIASEGLAPLKKQVQTIYNVTLKQLEKDLVSAGAGYTPGRGYRPKN